VVWYLRPDVTGVLKMHTVYNLKTRFVNQFNTLQRHKKSAFPPCGRKAESLVSSKRSFSLREKVAEGRMRGNSAV
jgi:hypothetical protein